jgi:ribosomal protein S27AE
MSEAAKVLLGKAEIKSAEALRAKLGKLGIEVALVHNEVTCGRGCAVQVEVWAHPDDLPEIQRSLDAERQKTFADMGYDARLAEAVFDKAAEAATCPACGTSFATSHSECPECGLCFETPEEAAASHGCRPKR